MKISGNLSISPLMDEPAVYQLTTNPSSSSSIIVNGAPVASGESVTLPGADAAPAATAETESTSGAE